MVILHIVYESIWIMIAADRVTVELSVVLGSSSIPMGQLLRMGRGALIELDTDMDRPVEIYANGSLIAYGELMVQGGNLAVSIVEKVTRAA